MISFLLYLLLPTCYYCFFVEINLHGRNESRSLQLLCGPPSENMDLKNKHRVLWHGSEFGSDEQQRLAGNSDADSLIPNLVIKTSNRHLCYLVTSEDFEGNQTAQRRRVSRNLVASIPMENGICPPGHRIDQNRCFPCFPGSYTSGQQAKCFLCPKDFYMDKKAADSCWPCPDGRKTLSQGADSEDACVYFDETGHPAVTQDTPWVAIYTMIGVIIACVWIIIVILLVRHWRELKQADDDQMEADEDKLDPRFRDTLLRKKTIRKDGDIYGTESDYSTSPADHIYAEISDSEDIYEEPLQPSDRDKYLDLEAPELPPKRRIKSIAAEGRKSVDGDGYELPVKRGSKDQYEIPTRRSDDHAYEIPIKKSSEDHFYEIPVKKLSDDGGYEIPIRKKRSDDRFRTMPKKNSADDHIYEEIPVKKSSTDEYEVPVRGISSVHQDDLYDDVQHMSDEREMAVGTSEENAGGRPPKTYSSTIRAFVRNPSSSAESARSNRGERKASNASRMQPYNKRKYAKNNQKSYERAADIPEETEDSYDIPEYDSSDPL